MNGSISWAELRESRMSEPGAEQSYQETYLAYELGGVIRALRERRGLSQSQLARELGIAQSAVARFEAGGTLPTLPLLDRLAQALAATMVVRLEPLPDPG